MARGCAPPTDLAVRCRRGLGPACLVAFLAVGGAGLPLGAATLPPIDAQAVYKSLDPTMLAVLTEANANIPALLKQAATNVNDVLQFATG